VEPSAVEIRVLGCLLEKQRTTPDAYPLTLNALRLACNQTTNRDPVVDYDEATIRDALRRLGERRWTRAASGAGSRAAKYRHLFDEALGLADDELALLTVLMLRGPQTPGELKSRADRLHHFADLDAVLESLEHLAGRGLAERLPRRPGEKQERWRQLVGGEEATGGGLVPSRPVKEHEAGEDLLGIPAGVAGGEAERDWTSERLDRLEAEVAAIRNDLAHLRSELGKGGEG
jgi:uncharacterized protein YceH (UPF0502 family)